MKKAAILILCIALVLTCLAGCSAENRHVYDYSTREVLSQEQHTGDSAAAPAEDGLKYITANADLIIEGEITSAGEQNIRFLAGTENTSHPLQLTTTVYKVKVNKVWFGKYTKRKLTLEIRGDKDSGVTKPHINDRGIFILSEYKEKGNYTLTAAEASIFIKNPPDDKLYAFADDAYLTAFDRKDPSELKKSMQEKLDLIKEQGTSDTVRGSIGREYLMAYLKNNPPE